MYFTWIESLLYGITMGLTEVLPVSAQAHSRILLKFMGKGSAAGILQLFVHLGILAALFLFSQNHMLKMSRASRMARVPKRLRKRPLDVKSLMDLRLLQTMLLPVVLAIFVWRWLEGLGSNLILIATFLFLNGLILYIPQFLPTSNKDSRSLSRVEGVLMGFGGTLAAIPGLSGMAGALSVASVAGVDRKYSLGMILMMNMGIMAGKIFYDLLAIIESGLAGLSFPVFLFCLLSGCAAYLGAWLAVKLLRALASNMGYSIFAYYSWGIALFSLILSLMT